MQDFSVYPRKDTEVFVCQIVKGNAALLQSLFGEFGQLEKSYRKKFENEIICLDKNQLLSAAGEEHHAILPFQMQCQFIPFTCHPLAYLFVSLFIYVPF